MNLPPSPKGHRQVRKPGPEPTAVLLAADDNPSGPAQVEGAYAPFVLAQLDAGIRNRFKGENDLPVSETCLQTPSNRIRGRRAQEMNRLEADGSDQPTGIGPLGGGFVPERRSGVEHRILPDEIDERYSVKKHRTTPLPD